MADVKIPGIGNVKKGYVALGVGGILVAGFIIYRRQKATAAAASNSAVSQNAGMVTDPAGNQCQALDPASGYCPGTTEDEQYQEQAASALGEGYDEYPGGGAGYGYITDANGNTCAALDPTTGLCPVATGSGTTTSVTTNAQWVVEAEEQLGNTATVQAALGYALAGQPVTAQQAQLFMEAVGLLGPPPQGYPPLNVTGTTGSAPPPGTVTVPELVGGRVEEATAALTALGLKSSFPSSSRKPNVAYHVTSQSPAAGTKVKTGSTVTFKIAAGA